MRRKCKYLPMNARGSSEHFFEDAYCLAVGIDQQGRGIALIERQDGCVIETRTNVVRFTDAGYTAGKGE